MSTASELTDLSEAEQIKQESRGLRGDLAAELVAETDHFSEDSRHLLKFHGSYEQEDRDLRRARKKEGLGPAYQFMIRSKVPGGVLSAAQYLVHDALAGSFGNGTLRVTTRQGIQLHGVVKGGLWATIHALNEALVSTLGACGDVVRNVVGCPAPIPGGARAEVLEIIDRVNRHFFPTSGAYHEIWIDGERVLDNEERAAEPDPIYGERYLPRKFKIAFAFPEDNCTDVHANDLGFLAVVREGRVAGFNVLVGGGLGQTHGKADTFPRLAEPLAYVTPDEVLDVATAVVAVQRDYGNRANRRRARLKYLIEERGIDWFRAETERYLGRALAPAQPVRVTAAHDHLGWHRQADGAWFYGLFVQNGRVADAENTRLRTALRTVAERMRPGFHLTPQQNVLLTGIASEDRAELDALLAEHGVRPPHEISAVRRGSMACPALPTCGLAVAESERVLPSVLDRLEGELAALGLARDEVTVRMTGCANGCARPYTADLGFVGRSLGKYAVYVGGNPRGTTLGAVYADLVLLEELVPTVLPLFARYARERQLWEGFGDFWNRVGLVPLVAAAGAAR